MLEKFRQTIQEHRLCKPEHKILLAVSGGIDSMVMMHLYQQLGKFRLAVAHCNFQLRGEESQGDLEFVREEAEKSGLKFLSTNFHTREYAAENKLSIQMAARDLRYSWFLQLAEEHAFHRVALAHNLDDIIETTLINLARGTGLKGLTGIKPISGIFIRPLLFASREDISCYAKNNGIRYREDSSNAETKYKRNLIRHKIMPLLEQLNPSIRETFQQETEIFHATWDLYHQEIERLKKKILLKKGRRQLVKITSIKEEEISAPLLFEILSDFGFSYPVIKDIINSLEGEPGKRFYSSKYILIKDREYLILEENLIETTEESIEIYLNTEEINYPVNLLIHKLDREKDAAIPKSGTIASLDLEKLKFPLRLRHWQNGDYFYPLGLSGRKKLSDFFTDEKIDRIEKDRIWLLTSGKDIVWVLGYRIDNRFKITPSTKKILRLEIID